MKRFLLSRPVGNGIRCIILLAMLLMSFGYGGADVAYAAPPGHDDFDAARLITGIEYHNSDDTTEGTPIPGVPDPPGDDPNNIPCDQDTLLAGFASVWYKYTPPEAQSISVNTIGSSYDTYIAIWTGTRGSLNLVACNDDTFEGQVSEVSFDATGGTTYYIEVAQFNDGTGGTTFIGGDLVFSAYITNTHVWVRGILKARYYVPETNGLRRNFINLNSGPVEIYNVANNQLIASQRVLYTVNGKLTSFSEMMGLPDNQLNKVYWLPWYNNKTLNTQLRFGNVSASTATVHVRIGGVEVAGSPYTLAPGASLRRSYTGIDRGPVKIESNVNIVAAERVIYNVGGVDTSYSEMMAFPASKVGKIFWMPWYNNKDMSTQLRITNVSNTAATIRVAIGGKLMKGSPFTLAPRTSRRLSYAGIDRGPVKIVSSVNIVASERVIYTVGGKVVSYSEMMGLPNSQLSTTYWMPWYNNKTVSTQVRFANVSTSTATVHVRIGGVEMPGSPFTLLRGQSSRKSFAGIDRGPVQIESNVNIIASERVIYTVGGKPISFSEMMGLSSKLLDVRYWMPWYNNVDLNTQLRLALP